MNEELEQIVQNMIDAGEPEENIALVIQSYKSSDPVKKKDGTKPQSPSTTPPVNTELGQTSGSLDMFPKPQSPTQIVLEGNKQIAQKQQPSIAEKSFKEQIKSIDPFKNEYKEPLTGEIKKINFTAPQNKNIAVANEAYDYAIKNFDEQKSIDRLNDELNAYQITDGIKDGMKGVFNKFIASPLNVINSSLGGDKDFRIGEYKPLELELKAAKNELKEELGEKTPITQAQIQKRAEEIFLKKDKIEQLSQLIDEALPRGYDREGVWKELKLDQLRSNDKLRSTVASVEVFSSQIKEFNDYAKKITSKEWEIGLSQEKINKYNYLREKAVWAVEGLKYIESNYDNYLKDAKTDEEKLQLFKYNYNDFEKNPTLLWNTAKNIVAGTTKLLADTSIYANKKMGRYYNPIAKAFSEMSSEELNKNEADSNQFYRYKASNINNWSDLGSLTTQLFSEQIPVLASIYMGGNTGIGTVSLSSGGQKINELEEQSRQPFGKIYSEGEKLAAGYLYAGAEFFPEKFGTARILKDLERTVSSATLSSRKLFTDGLLKSTFNGIKKTAKNTFLEGGTEYVTAEGQIAIDKDLLNIVESDYTKNQKRAEGFFSGALIGGSMSAVGGSIGFGIAQSKLYSDRQDVKKVQSILKNIELINSEIENNKLLSDSEKKELYSKMNEMNNQAFAIVEKNAMRGANLSVREKSFLLDVNQKQNLIREKVNEIKNSNYSDDVKNRMLNDLKAEFETLEENRNKILNGEYDSSMNSVVKQQEIEIANAENQIPTAETEIESEAEIQKQPTISKETEQENPIVFENKDIETLMQETESKIKRKDLFSDGGSFSRVLGGSEIDSVPTNHQEINGIEFVQFSNQNTGVVDVVMSGTSDSDFVGYYRIYENGKPTNKWSSKFENQSRNKQNFKTMISGVQSMLPKGHQYTEKTSISTDGLRVWEQQLSRGYEIQTDSNGNIITDEVAINGDAIVNELGINVEQGQFNNISVTNNEQFVKVKKVLIPYLTKLGLTEKNIRWENGTVKIDLPVLRQKTNETQTQGDVVSDGNIRPTTEQVGEMAVTEQPTAEVTETEVVESAVEPKSSEKVTVYHGGIIENYDGGEDLYVTEDKNQASLYAKGNEGGIYSFDIDKSKVATEELARKIIKDLGLKTNSKDYSNDELKLHELIDPKFEETALSDSDRKKLYKELSKRGFEAVSFIDEDLDGGRSGVENIAIFGEKPKAKEVLLKQREADQLFSKGYRPIINGVVKKDFTQEQLDEYFDENDEIYMTNNLSIEKPTRKETRIKATEAKIDEIANSIKGLESVFGIKIKADTNGENIQGTSRDQLIDFIAKTAKEIAKTGIEIDEAIRSVISELKKSYDVDIEIDEVKKVAEPAQDVKTINVDVKTNEVLPVSNSFSESASTVPNSGEVGEYLSGKTIEKYTGEEAENDQTIQRVKLLDALRHGVNTIEMAKIEFGDQFVEKTLEFLKNNNVSIEAKALTYISLENELNKQKLENPQDKSKIQKQLNLVREKRQAFARSNSLALNMNRLQAFAKAGYDVNQVTDRMFSTVEKEARKKIEQAVQSNADQINDEAVSVEEDGFTIAEPKTKRDKAVVKAEISDVVKKMRQDLLKASKGQLSASIPYAQQLIVATPHIIKLTKLFAELGGLKTKEIIDSVYDEISSVFPSIKRKDVSDVVKKEFQQNTKSEKQIKLTDLVKNALIEAGYSRQVKVKGEVRTYLDWKKLAGEEGSVDRIKETVERTLKGKGYSKSQISEMAELLQKEYEDLRSSIIEKSIRELQNRNTIKPTANVKGIAKKLAELYNYGLFEENMETYNNLLNSALGFNAFDQEQFDKLKEYARALSVLFGAENSLNNSKKLSELAVRTQANLINREIKSILRNAQFKNAPSYFKIATIIRDFVNISLTSKLMSAKQMIENPMSGFIERQFQNIGNMFNTKENGELKANRKKLAKYIYSDIVRNGGLFYGDVSNTLVSQSAVEDWLNKQSDNKIYHFVVSAMLGRAYLNGADSMNKALLTEKNFAYNLIKILTSDSNPQGKMTKDEAMKFVAEKTTGQNFNEALKIASDLIEKVNSDAGKQLIPNNSENKYRFAMDIVKESLASGTELTLEQVEKAYNAGYKSAGFAIGHEANNPISLISNMGSARIEGLLDKAVKEKKWQEAVMYSMLSSVVKGIINPFVGGSFNWMTLTLQKAGLDPVSVFSDLARSKSNPIDLSTETGLNNLQNALVRDTNLKNTYNRYVIGAGVSIMMASLAIATGADDDLESWLKNNEWARKYFNVASPPALLLLMSVKNEDLGDYLTKLLNVKVDNMDSNVRILKSIDKEDQSTLGALGQVVGQPFDTPLPWRIVRDIDNIKRGMNGRPLVKSTFETNGFWNGYFQGGLSDYLGLRPGENYKTKEKIQQIRQETKVYNEQVKKLAKDAVEQKYSDKVLNEKIVELFSKEPLKIEKTKNIFKNKVKDELMRKKVKDPFYIDFKRENNDEIQAIMFFDKFGDVNNLSDSKRVELSENMQTIGFKGSDEFWAVYWSLVNSNNKKSK